MSSAFYHMVGITGFEPVTSNSRSWRANRTALHPEVIIKIQKREFVILTITPSLNLSGYQDSNLGPPAPKAGALTGLRYIPFY